VATGRYGLRAVVQVSLAKCLDWGVKRKVDRARLSATDSGDARLWSLPRGEVGLGLESGGAVAEATDSGIGS